MSGLEFSKYHPISDQSELLTGLTDVRLKSEAKASGNCPSWNLCSDIHPATLLAFHLFFPSVKNRLFASEAASLTASPWCFELVCDAPECCGVCSPCCPGGGGTGSALLAREQTRVWEGCCVSSSACRALHKGLVGPVGPHVCSQVPEQEFWWAAWQTTAQTLWGVCRRRLLLPWGTSEVTAEMRLVPHWWLFPAAGFFWKIM